MRTALWRALHVRVDPPPHVLVDEIGLALLEPAGGWRERHDMLPGITARSRATVVGRARFIEDLVLAEATRGVRQYAILGAGLDSFAQRHPDAGLRVYEVDQPGASAWKKDKLRACGFDIPAWLRLVPMDFEQGDDWPALLAAEGFDARSPAVVASTGVVAFLTRDAILRKLRRIAALAPGSTLVMTFLVPTDLMDEEERANRRRTEDFARRSGTPWLSLFSPADMMALAREAGFPSVRHVSATELAGLYFTGRPDGLRPSSGEEILVATT